VFVGILLFFEAVLLVSAVHVLFDYTIFHLAAF